MAKSTEDVETAEIISISDEKTVIRNAMRLVRAEQSSQITYDLIFSTKMIDPMLMDMNLLWLFTRQEKKYRIKIQMKTSKQIPEIYQIDDERQKVEVLRIISRQNCKYVQESFLFVIEPNSIISMYIQLPLELVTSEKYFQVFLKNKQEELTSRFVNLLDELRPYLKQNLPTIMKQYSEYLKRCSCFISYVEYQQINRIEQRRNLQQNTSQPLDSDIFIKILENRKKNLDKLKQGVIIASMEKKFITTISEVDLKNAQQNYQEWKRAEKHKKQPQNDVQVKKNVYGVKILKQITQKIYNVKGNHSKVLLGRYNVVFTTSLSNETNKTLPQPEQNNQGEQIQIVKKICCEPAKQSSIKALKNELHFIYFVRDRKCKYLASYYLEPEKKLDDMKYIMMVYYPRSLQEYINRSKNSPTYQKFCILQQITRGASWLVENHICHRDLKPANIMLDCNGLPKVLDFGSCCPIEGEVNMKSAEKKLLGTPGYYFCYKDLDSNVKKRYSITAYYQHTLFDAYSIGQIIENALYPKDYENQNFGEIVRYMILKCSQQDPEYRFTYQEMLFLFERIIKYLGGRLS